MSAHDIPRHEEWARHPMRTIRHNENDPTSPKRKREATANKRGNTKPLSNECHRLAQTKHHHLLNAAPDCEGDLSLRYPLAYDPRQFSRVFLTKVMCFDGCLALCERLRRNDPSLTVLDLSQKFMGNDGAKALASALAENTQVVVLFLQHNQLGPSGARALVAALSKHPRLAHLYLDDNHLGDEGCLAIAELIRKSRTLQVLKLSDNRVGTQGAKSIASALPYANTLQYLCLQKNFLKEQGIQSICNAVAHTQVPNLRWLDLRCNKVHNYSNVLKGWIEILRDNQWSIPNQTLCILELWETAEWHTVQRKCGDLQSRLEFWLKWNRAGRRSLANDNESLPLCRLLANSHSPSVMMATLVARPDLIGK